MTCYKEALKEMLFQEHEDGGSFQDSKVESFDENFELV
jgi:hypothetical protein